MSCTYTSWLYISSKHTNTRKKLTQHPCPSLDSNTGSSDYPTDALPLSSLGQTCFFVLDLYISALTFFPFSLLFPLQYTSSCQYDDSSVEISSDSDRRQSLSREAKTDISSSSKEKIGANDLFFSFSKSVESTSSFSQSGK